jgi:hypothetical protein
LAKKHRYCDSSLAIEARLDDLFAKLTLEEKASSQRLKPPLTADSVA